MSGHRPPPATLTVALLSLAACAGHGPRGGAASSAADRLREQALAVAARDDGASLARARAMLDDAARAEPPARHRADADRALVELLAADARRAPTDALAEEGRDLRERALDELRRLSRDHPEDAAVARALALYYGLDGNAAPARKLARQARGGGPPDAWLELAELTASLAEPGADRTALLTRFIAAHPAMLRARILLARAQLDAWRTDDALRTLDDLLAANPEHDRAKALKALVLSPPPARVDVVPVPESAPAPLPSGRLPRKSRAGGAG